MTEQELTALKAEWRAEFEREALNQKIREKMNRNIVTATLDEYQSEYKSFDWVEHWSCVRYDGTLANRDYEQREAYKVRIAIAALVKAHFKVNRVEHIPYEKRDEARTIIETILRAVAV